MNNHNLAQLQIWMSPTLPPPSHKLGGSIIMLRPIWAGWWQIRNPLQIGLWQIPHVNNSRMPTSLELWDTKYIPYYHIDPQQLSYFFLWQLAIFLHHHGPCFFSDIKIIPPAMAKDLAQWFKEYLLHRQNQSFIIEQMKQSDTSHYGIVFNCLHLLSKDLVFTSLCVCVVGREGEVVVNNNQCRRTFFLFHKLILQAQTYSFKRKYFLLLPVKFLLKWASAFNTGKPERSTFNVKFFDGPSLKVRTCWLC